MRLASIVLGERVEYCLMRSPCYPNRNDSMDKNRHFLFDIVANKRNSVDVDKFDYLQRVWLLILIVSLVPAVLPTLPISLMQRNRIAIICLLKPPTTSIA